MMINLRTIHHVTKQMFLLEDCANGLLLCGLDDVSVGDVLVFPLEQNEWLQIGGNLQTLPAWPILQQLEHWEVVDVETRFVMGLTERFTKIVPIVNLDKLMATLPDNIIPFIRKDRKRATA